ncbi:hypothetical protein V6N13_039479 [Hibiscus sabdariffa]
MKSVLYNLPWDKIRQSQDSKTENLNPPQRLYTGSTRQSPPLAIILCLAPPAAPHLSPPQKPSHPIRLVSGSL